MNSFIFKGEFTMSDYGTIKIYKSDVGLKETNHINEMYDIFKEYLNYINNVLNQNDIDAEEWDLTFVDKEACKTVESIKNKFVEYKSEYWRKELSNILKNIIGKTIESFRIADRMYKDDMEKCEQYYDLLVNIFYDTEEYIKIKYNDYTRSITQIQKVIIQKENTFSDPLNKNFEYVNNIKNTNDKYELAA